MDNKNNINLQQNKQKLSGKWWGALFAGIVTGIVLFIAVLAIFANSAFNMYKEMSGTQGLDKNIKAPASVIYEDSDYKIEFLSLVGEYDSIILNLKLENKTSKDVSLSASTWLLNGYSFTPVMFEEVPGNTTIEGQASTNANLNLLGLDQITDIQVDFKVYDDGDGKILKAEPILTNLADSFDQEARDKEIGGKVLFDNDYITIIQTPPAYDIKFDSNDIYLKIINKTDYSLSMNSTNLMVNNTGIKSSALIFNDSAPRANRKERVMIFDSDLKGIDKIETIEIDLNYTLFKGYEALIKEDIPRLELDANMK